MSAYIVDRDHLLYLVSAATSSLFTFRGVFSWLHDGQWYDLPYDDYKRCAEIANLLWRENIASVGPRYPHESSASLPGPSNGDFVIKPSDFPTRFTEMDPVQVIKACDCYEYQSCEHEGWITSEAHTFICTLRREAWTSVPGYVEAAWGAPGEESV